MKRYDTQPRLQANGQWVKYDEARAEIDAAERALAISEDVYSKKLAEMRGLLEDAYVALDPHDGAYKDLRSRIDVALRSARPIAG